MEIETKPLYDPADRPVGSTRTDKLAGVTPEVGFTRIQDVDADAENEMPDDPPMDTACAPVGFCPCEAANTSVAGVAVVTACTCSVTGIVKDPFDEYVELIVITAV